MRKIIAIVLAVVMIAAMSVTVFAEKNLSNEDTKSPAIPVTYNVDKGYTITIPDNFELTDTNDDTAAEGTGNVVINSAKLNSGETLKVTVTSENYDKDSGKDWRLLDNGGADPLPYTITVSDVTEAAADGYTNGGISGTLAHGGVVISYTSASKAFKPLTSKMDLQTEKTNQAGDFKDNLTFVSAVVTG